MRVRQESLKEPTDIIGYLLGSALKYWEADDRFLALAAANHYDRTNGTHFGRVILSKFMKRANLELLKVDSATTDYVAAVSTETKAVGQISRAVALALGHEIGGQVLVGELNEDRETMSLMSNVPGTITVTSRTHDLYLPSFFPEDEFDIAGLSDDRPFIVARAGNPAQTANYSSALKATLLGTN
jgi:hypothetical protein